MIGANAIVGRSLGDSCGQLSDLQHSKDSCFIWEVVTPLTNPCCCSLVPEPRYTHVNKLIIAGSFVLLKIK